MLGHWSGAVMLLGLARVHATHERPFGWLTGALGVAALIAKIGHSRAIAAGAPDALTLERARLFDVGHSHGTFLTDEFGFILARRHALALRIAALTAGFVVPEAWIVSGAAGAPLAWLAAIVCLAGLLAERWLFFAEAQHTVRLYHGAPRT